MPVFQTADGNRPVRLHTKARAGVPVHAAVDVHTQHCRSRLVDLFHHLPQIRAKFPAEPRSQQAVHDLVCAGKVRFCGDGNPPFLTLGEKVATVRRTLFAGADDAAGNPVPVQQQSQHIPVTGIVAAAGDNIDSAVPVKAAEYPQPCTVHQDFAVCSAGNFGGIAVTHNGNGDEFFHGEPSCFKKGNAISQTALPFFLLWQYRTKIVRQMRRQIFRQMKQKAE